MTRERTRYQEASRNNYNHYHELHYQPPFRRFSFPPSRVESNRVESQLIHMKGTYVTQNYRGDEEWWCIIVVIILVSLSIIINCRTMYAITKETRYQHWSGRATTMTATTWDDTNTWATTTIEGDIIGWYQWLPSWFDRCFGGDALSLCVYRW